MGVHSCVSCCVAGCGSCDARCERIESCHPFPFNHRKTYSTMMLLPRKSRSRAKIKLAMMLRSKQSEFFLLTTCLLLFPVMVTAFRFQKDTDESCSSESIEDCIQSDTLWFKCPITCSRYLMKEGSMKENQHDPEIFFQMQVTKQDGKSLDLEDFEGYVTLYATIPLIPGMSQFYYEMLEHVQGIFPYTIETLVAPYNISLADEVCVSITPRQEPKTILLKEVIEPSPVLEYLVNAEIVAGNDEAALLLDRVTIFIVSTDGVYIERLISPTMPLLERRVSVFLMQMDVKPIGLS